MLLVAMEIEGILRNNNTAMMIFLMAFMLISFILGFFFVLICKKIW
jgi:hypothetical protein